MYRSFLTCNDPKGVADCSIVRKPKASSPKVEKKSERRKSRKNSDELLSKKEENVQMLSKGVGDEFPSSCSSHLRKVSKDAEKLNHMIGSWAKEVSYDDQSKGIAKDLLKGALDLQESLFMLSKLQEDSQCRGNFNENKKLGMTKIGKVGPERRYINQFEEHSPLNLKEYQHSANGVLREGNGALKRISDSIAMQNPELEMITDSTSEMASTSSSQSSMAHLYSPASSDKSLNKVKGTNLISRLMGLEGFPEEQMPAACQKEFAASYQQRPIFDSQMLEARKSRSVAKKVDSKRRSLDETTEKVLSERHLKSNSGKSMPKKVNAREQHSKDKMHLEAQLFRSNNIHSSLEDKEIPLTWISQRRVREHKEVQKPKEVIISPRGSSLPVLETSGGKLIDKKPLMSKNGTLANNWQLENDLEKAMVTPRNPSIHASQTKVNANHHQSSSRTNTISKYPTEPTINCMKKNQRREISFKAPAEVNSMTNNLRGQKDGRTIYLTDGRASVLISRSPTPVQLFPTKAETVGCQPRIVDCCNECQTSSPDVKQQCQEHETYIGAAEAYQFISNRTDGKRRMNLKALLLSSPLFLSHVAEVFGMSGQIQLHTSCSDTGGPFRRVALDCATELVERKKLQDSANLHNCLLPGAGNPRVPFSIDKLVHDVCDSVESLTRYSILTRTNLLVNVLCMMTEDDLRHRGMTNAMWDLGWWNGYSLDEAEQVVDDLEKQVLSSLIEEVCT